MNWLFVVVPINILVIILWFPHFLLCVCTCEQIELRRLVPPWPGWARDWFLLEPISNFMDWKWPLLLGNSESINRLSDNVIFQDIFSKIKYERDLTKVNYVTDTAALPPHYCLCNWLCLLILFYFFYIFTLHWTCWRLKTSFWHSCLILNAFTFLKMYFCYNLLLWKSRYTKVFLFCQNSLSKHQKWKRFHNLHSYITVIVCKSHLIPPPRAD